MMFFINVWSICTIFAFIVFYNLFANQRNPKKVKTEIRHDIR